MATECDVMCCRRDGCESVYRSGRALRRGCGNICTRSRGCFCMSGVGIRLREVGAQHQGSLESVLEVIGARGMR